MTGDDGGALRLDAVAALIDLDLAASREANAWIGIDGEPCSDNEAELITSAASGERQLADALRGPHGYGVPESDAEAIAGLLRLVGGADVADRLCTGLRQAFLIPDDSQHAPAREDRTATFAGLYIRLALPGLSGGAAERARALLAELDRP